MVDFVVALALVLVIEGLLWAGFPDMMRRAALRLAEIDTGALRLGGLAAMVMGVIVLWWVRS